MRTSVQWPGDVAAQPGDDTPTAKGNEVDGDRPVQVGSHYHFAEANEALRFDRGRTIGFRLAVPAGTSVRFEPGVQRSVELVAYGGDHIVAGFRGLYGGVV